MQDKIFMHQDVNDKESAYGHALHALQEYRLWRDNVYVGREMGAARDAYVNILRQRVLDAIDGYKTVRTQNGGLLHHAA
jgi:hypothetical protein